MPFPLLLRKADCDDVRVGAAARDQPHRDTFS